MKKLLNVAIFGSVFFIALAASDRGYLTKSKDVSKRMISEHPFLTGIGSSLIGLDLIRSMRGKEPINYLKVKTPGGLFAFNYFRNGQLIKTYRSPGATRQLLRQRNLGAFLLGYSAYKTYKNKR